MMTKNLNPQAIETILNDIQSILDSTRQISQFSASQIEQYARECEQIPALIGAGRLRIAVVGVIKSGKSTFVNSMVGKELVQQGAGVITSITTRIRKGKKNQATLVFKSWDQINMQLQNALQLFPDNKAVQPDIKAFDIRRRDDRNYLEQVYNELIEDFPVINDEISPQTLLMKYALNGFDSCKDLVQADESVTSFSSNQFEAYKGYTSDPNKAFYVKDVCLDVYGKVIDPHIEIADCQGADSTDPAQLEQILNYIESANLIIYCISSRIGLRQSDIMFLKRIERLGRMNNILFINNCDLSEHENLDDLLKIEAAIKESLGFLKIKPEIFSFSVLCNLFQAQLSRLKKKDQARLELWLTEKKMVQYCDENTQNFYTHFKQITEQGQYSLLVSSHLNRLDMILGQIDSQADIFLDLVSSDATKEEGAKVKLKQLCKNAQRLKAIVAGSIDRQVAELKDQIDANIMQMFNLDAQALLKETKNFISSVYVDVEKYRPRTKESGFNQIIYLLFQDIKRELDLHTIEIVRPKLREFVRIQEAHISSFFETLYESYEIDLTNEKSYLEFESGQGDKSLAGDWENLIDIEKIKQILGIRLPEDIFKSTYTPKMKFNVLTDFSLHTMVQVVKSLFNKKDSLSFTPGLNKAVEKIKTENIKALSGQVQICQSQLQVDYLRPLIDAVSRDFKEKIDQRFEQYDRYEKQIEGQILLNQSQKQEQKIKILDLKKRIQGTIKEITAMGENLPK